MKSRVKWIIQGTMAGNKTLSQLSRAISKSGAVHELIELAPFSAELRYDIIDDFKPVIYGSTTFMLLAYRHEYLSSGVFYHEGKFLMSEYIKHWGQKVLNNDAIIHKAGEVSSLAYDNDQIFFVRPNEDSKALAGSLMRFQDYKAMVNEVLDENPYIASGTELAISSPKIIDREWRNIIIQGKVVSSCRYRVFGEPSIDEDDAPVGMVRFAEELCSHFVPHDVFVMDVCECAGKYFVIECNCFNGSGIYNTKDLSKIVSAVNMYVENKSSNYGIV